MSAREISVCDIGNFGAKINAKNISLQEIKKICKLLTIKEAVNYSKGNKYTTRTTVSAYKLEDDFVIVPRYFILNYVKDPKSTVRSFVYENDYLQSSKERTLLECEYKSGDYRDYQSAAIQYLCNNVLAEQLGCAYLHIGAGLGKTRIGCGLISMMKTPTIVVVPAESIALQWIEELNQLFPLLKTVLYRNNIGEHHIFIKYDVIIVIINTIRNKTIDFINGAGMMILDEAHEYYTKHNKNVLWLAQTKYVIGLSASPNERKDGLDKFVNLFIGDPITSDKIPGFGDNTPKFSGFVRVIEYSGHPDHCATAITNSGTVSNMDTINNICSDIYRRRMIAHEVKRLYKLHETASKSELESFGLINGATHGIIIFAEMRDYLPLLKAEILSLLGEDTKINIENDEDEEDDEDRGFKHSAQLSQQSSSSDISVLRGGTTRDELMAAKTQARIILTTYGYSRRGVSITDMTSLIIATPRRNGWTQILGRITRLGSNPAIVRQIVDIVDTKCSLRSQFSDRKNIYQEKGYPIMKHHARWEDQASEDDKRIKRFDNDISEMSMEDLLNELDALKSIKLAR